MNLVKPTDTSIEIQEHQNNLTLKEMKKIFDKKVKQIFNDKVDNGVSNSNVKETLSRKNSKQITIKTKKKVGSRKNNTVIPPVKYDKN